MKKVLIVTYYWPPAGGSGVQRILKFAKYLPEFGWKPLILTPSNGEFPVFDNSLYQDIPNEAEVFQSFSFESGGIYRALTGTTGPISAAILAEENPGWRKNIANFIRANFFIPDAKIGWLPTAIPKGLKIVDKYKPDIIFSSSPPPTVHLIAESIAKKTNLPWLADFRDPWTKIFYYDNAHRSIITRKLDEKIEKRIVNTADATISVSQGFANLIGKRDSFIIPNGYDKEDFCNIHTTKHKTNKFTISHIGTLSPAQDLVNVWTSIGMLLRHGNIQKEHLSIVFAGYVHYAIKKYLYDIGLMDYCVFKGYVSHHEAIHTMAHKSDVLLLSTTGDKSPKGQVPAKLFEYMAANTFVLAVCPHYSEIVNIIKKCKAGVTIPHSALCEDILMERYNAWIKGTKFCNNRKEVEQNTRREETITLAKLLDTYSILHKRGHLD